jgi:hypothetical protein
LQTLSKAPLVSHGKSAIMPSGKGEMSWLLVVLGPYKDPEESRNANSAQGETAHLLQ